MTFSNVENTRVWFVTGASSGLGYVFTKKALESGDKVVGVARNIEKLNELKYHFVKVSIKSMTIKEPVGFNNIIFVYSRHCEAVAKIERA